MGKIRKILETELVGGTQSTDVYPVTSTKAVYDTDNKVLDDYIQQLKKTSTFAGIATPTTNPGTPNGNVFYIAGEGTYVNFSNLVIEAGQLGILKWNGTWSKEVLEIDAGGGSGGGSGVSLGTLLAQLNAENPLPSANGQALTYNGSNFVWKTPTGGSGGSTSTSVSWQDVTGKPSTFTPSSHTHPTSEITGLSNYVQGVKVNNASAADRLANAVTLWGNNFSGNNSIGTASSYADLQYVKNIYAGNVFDIKAGNNSLLKVDNNPNIYVGFDYKANVNASILLFGNKTTIYTSGDDYRYDFKSNIFDVNSNQIHFGSETNGGRISWDAANNAFKIEGNVYATGGITALGVSNNATTSNNVDFTFRSVTANTFNVKNSIQISDTLNLSRNGNNVYLGSTDVSNPSYIYLDGMDQNYSLDSQGHAYFNHLNCDSLSFNGVQNFEIVDINDTSFNIQFTYNGKTYKFFPSNSDITVS